MKKSFLTICLPFLVVSCVTSPSLKTPRLLGGAVLSSQYGSPDGYAISPSGDLIVSMNQKAVNWASAAKIMKINSNDETISEYFTLPVNGETGVCSPMGVKFASDGNMYVSDNQSFFTDKPNMSSVIRVNHENGVPTTAETVVVGFNMSNGVTSNGDYLYVAETNLGVKDVYTSGVYRFKLSELISGDTLVVTGVGDPHLILSFTTKEQGVGANGIAFDSKGNLFVNNFGDSEIRKYSFDANGNIISDEMFLKVDEAESLDGMQIDSEDNIWVADFVGNAILSVSIPTKKVTLVAKNSVPVVGENGELDAPSECIKVGNKVFISNIDINHAAQTSDDVQVISVIDL